MRMRKFVRVFLLLIPFGNLAAQNLIYNGGFEVHSSVPKYQSQIKLAVGWFRPTRGTPDYFNRLSGKTKIGAPYNFMGYQQPRTGEGYGGFYLYESADLDGYREYLSTKLKSTLERGKQYQVKFYVSLADYSEMAISNIEVLFTPNEIKRDGSERIPIKPQLKYTGDVITDTAHWVELLWTYTAKGNEQYMTIGNFEKAAQCNVTELVHGLAKGISLDAYYYIDDVCVERLKQDTVCKCEQDTARAPGAMHKKDTLHIRKKTEKLNIEPEQNIILQHIYFETNKSDLLPASFQELNQLVQYLKKNPKAAIELSGYTDNTGRESKNQKLSDARAKAVADYIKQKGIHENRITYKGYGSANPIADNTTKEGKAKNRRVEFTVHLN